MVLEMGRGATVKEYDDTYNEKQRRAAIKADYDADVAAEKERRKVVPIGPPKAKPGASVEHRPRNFLESQRLAKQLQRILSAVVASTPEGRIEIPIEVINGQLPDVEFETLEINGALTLRIRAM